MLTPYFTCSQDDEFVYIDIKVSHIRFDAPGVQIIAENELFIFSLSPYYLRLRFDKQLIDDEERSNAHYESKEEVIKVKIPKLNKGEVFQDLELPQKLLARAGETVGEEKVLGTKELLSEMGVSADENLIREVDADLRKEETKQEDGPKRPLIEEVGGTKTDLEKTAEEGTAFNWEINQTLETPSTDTKIKYGFDNRFDSVVGVSLSNGNDINELDDPEHTSADDRIKERLLKENFKFDPEYYAADYMTSKYSEDDPELYSEIKDLLLWENPVLKNTAFNEDQNEKMLQLPKRTYLIQNPKPLYYSILSLLFGYAYESRETQGELNTESAWSIGKLTPQISTLDMQVIFSDSSTPLIKALIITGIRRALSFPLHRHYGMALKAWGDVVKMLRLGKNLVIKVLLELREPFRFHDVYYVYDKVLLEDLVNWLINDDKDNDFVFKSLAGELENHLGKLEKKEIVFEQLDEDGDVDTFLDIQEIESLAETMYLESKA